MGKKPKRSKSNARRRKPSASVELSRRWFDRGLGAVAAFGLVALVRLGTRGFVSREVDPSTPIGIAWLPEEIDHHRANILRAAVAHDVDPKLVAIIVLVESRGNAAAQSPVGARGLMQVMPQTARYIAKRRGQKLSSLNALYDPETNLDYGTWFLARLLEQFHHRNQTRTVEVAAGAYNGGPGRMRKHLDRGRTLPGETRRYMEAVRGLWEERDAPRSETLARLWPAKGPTGRA